MIIKVNCSDVGVDRKVGGTRFRRGQDSLGHVFVCVCVWGVRSGSTRRWWGQVSELSRIAQASPLYPFANWTFCLLSCFKLDFILFPRLIRPLNFERYAL